MVWNLWAMARMPEYYEDALQFKPERWLDSENGGKIIKTEALFIPFMYGPRTCLGQKMVIFST